MEEIFDKSFSERHLTYKDYSSLINLIMDDLEKANVSPYGLHKLFLLIEKSKKYISNNIPENIVTLNSEMILGGDRMKKRLFRIVVPSDLVGENDMSVYSPIGIACLGKKEKDFVYVRHGNRQHKLQIEKIIFQPEKEKVNYL
jgi:regulator of nucleoside diphosphate kinase